MFRKFFTSKAQPIAPQDDKKNSQKEDVIQRAQRFFQQLEQRAAEVAEEAKESAQLLADADTDPYKRSYLQFKGAILHQLTAIIQKGSDTYQHKIIPQASSQQMMVLNQIFQHWNQQTLQLMTQLFEQVEERDLEKEYAAIMAEYQDVIEDFTCRQCGADLQIDQFYFTATYLPCPFCQTQNTFDPGTRARQVEHMAQRLAEARCKDAYLIYREKKSTEGQAAARDRYAEYVQAVVAEMNRILPGIEKQHQNYYTRRMSDYDHLPIGW